MLKALMVMRGKVTDAQTHCVEVKPLINSSNEPENFRSILEALFNCAKPFKFLIINTLDENVKGRQLVRFLIQFSNKQIQKQTAAIIKALLNVEITAIKPPQKQFPYQVDLKLAKNYAPPICNLEEEVNLIDRIVAVVASSDTAIEVTALVDRRAVVGIQNHIRP